MVLKVNKKGGGSKTIGRVSRGAAGGSQLGDTTGLQPTGKQIGGKPVYGPRPDKGPTQAVQALGIVPNFQPANGSAPTYVPPPNVPNTSTPAGPVYTPPPPPPPAPATLANRPPVAGAGSSSQEGASGSAGSSQASAPTPQLRQVTLADDNGVLQAYEYDPNQSFISQTGRYQYDFWTKEGQKERLLNALEVSGFGKTSVQFSGGNNDPTSLPLAKSAINVLNAASLLYGAASLFKAMSSMGKLGQLAATPQGVQAIAGSTRAAATASTAAKTAAGVAKNPGTTANAINGIKTLLAGNKAITVGAAIALIGQTASGIESTNKEKTQFSKESKALQAKLIDAGMFDMARELYETNKDIRTGFDQLLPYIPLFGDNAAKSRIQEARDELYETEIAFERFEKQAIEQAKAEAQAQEAADQQAAREDSQAFQAQQQEDTQSFQASEREARQQFELQQQQQAFDRQQGLDATATQDSGSSTLTFGLLGTGGSTEFVDKDRAARYYFTKPYEELTAAQKALLNLLKGGN